MKDIKNNFEEKSSQVKRGMTVLDSTSFSYASEVDRENYRVERLAVLRHIRTALSRTRGLTLDRFCEAQA